MNNISKPDYDKLIDEASNELVEMKKSNADAWNMYGSELCAGDMLEKERKIENKINQLKKEKNEMDC